MVVEGRTQLGADMRQPLGRRGPRPAISRSSPSSRPFMAGLVIGLVAVLIPLGARGDGPAAAAPLGGVAAVEALECSADDLIYSLHQGLVPRSSGAAAAVTGAASAPKEALRRFLADDHAYLLDLPITVAAATENTVQLVYETNDKLELTALAEQTKETWSVSSFSACNELLVSTQTREARS